MLYKCWYKSPKKWQCCAAFSILTTISFIIKTNAWIFIRIQTHLNVDISCCSLSLVSMVGTGGAAMLHFQYFFPIVVSQKRLYGMELNFILYYTFTKIDPFLDLDEMNTIDVPSVYSLG